MITKAGSVLKVTSMPEIGWPTASLTEALTLAGATRETEVTGVLLAKSVSAKETDVLPVLVTLPPVTVYPMEPLTSAVPTTVTPVIVVAPLVLPPVRVMVANPLLSVRAVPAGGVITP